MTLSNDKGDNTTEKAFMMRFLIHMIGDVHQPMDCSTKFSDEYPEPQGDKGGSAFSFKLVNQTSIDLHSYWEKGALYLDNPISRPLNKQTNS